MSPTPGINFDPLTLPYQDPPQNVNSMADWDNAFELADLKRKLDTANAQLAYRESCAKTHTLDSAEEQRKLRVRLMILDSQYLNLYTEYLEDEKYIEKVEAALREAYASLRWHKDALARYKAKNQGLQEKLQSALEGEQRQQEEEAAALRASLEEALGEKKLLEERVLRLDDELEQTAIKKLDLDFQLASSGVDIKELGDENSRLKGQFVELEDKQRQNITERQTLQREIAGLQLKLEDAQKTATRVAETATEKEHAKKKHKQELADMKAALKKETKAKEKAEKELARSREDWEARHKVLEAKLESARNKAKASSAATTATTTGPTKVSIDKPLKRQALTMEDLEHSAKRQRKTPPKTSEFSMTPFLKRQVSGMVSTSPAAIPRGDASNAIERIPPGEPDAGEQSAMAPAVVEGRAPTKILLAGASRKKKITKPSISEGEDPKQPLASPPPLKPMSPPKGALSLLSSPSPPPPSQSPERPKSKHRKRRAAAQSSGDASFYSRGIKPTVFDEDDGSGRLLLNNLGESQDPPIPKKSPQNLFAGGSTLLIPSVSAFNAEFSPPKRRPEALKKLFAGGVKK